MRPVLFEIPLFLLPFGVYLALAAALLGGGALLGSRLRRGRSRGAGLGLSLGALVLGGALLWAGMALLGLPRAPVGIPSYGVFLGLGLFLGFALAVVRARRLGLPEAEAGLILASALAAGLLGARLFYFLSRPEALSAAALLRIGDGGLSSAGGILSGALYAALFARRRGISARRLFDAAAPAAALGVALARVGCLLHGCDFGAPTELPVAVTYPAEWRDPADGAVLESPASAYQHSAEFAREFPDWVEALAAYDDRSQGDPISLPVHPLPAYEAGAALLIALGGLAFGAAPGLVAIGSGALYAAARLGLEGLRGDGEPALYGLTMGQWLSLFFLVWLFLAWLGRLRAPRLSPEEPRS